VAGSSADPRHVGVVFIPNMEDTDEIDWFVIMVHRLVAWVEVFFDKASK
jgi:hypothetical protein